MTQAVAELDARLAAVPPTDHMDRLVQSVQTAMEPPRLERHRADPCGFPMPRGVIQRFDGFGDDDQTSFRYKTIRLGRALIWQIPTAYCTPEYEAGVADQVEIAESREDACGPGLVE